MKKSTNNAFTGATNSINWKPSQFSASAQAGGAVTAKKIGTPVFLPNSNQVRAYSAAGSPK